MIVNTSNVTAQGLELNCCFDSPWPVQTIASPLASTQDSCLLVSYYAAFYNQRIPICITTVFAIFDIDLFNCRRHWDNNRLRRLESRQKYLWHSGIAIANLHKEAGSTTYRHTFRRLILVIHGQSDIQQISEYYKLTTAHYDINK